MCGLGCRAAPQFRLQQHPTLFPRFVILRSRGNSLKILNLKLATLLRPPNSARSFEAKSLKFTSNSDTISVLPRIMRLINVSSMVVRRSSNRTSLHTQFCLILGKEGSLIRRYEKRSGKEQEGVQQDRDDLQTSGGRWAGIRMGGHLLRR